MNYDWQPQIINSSSIMVQLKTLMYEFFFPQRVTEK